MANPVFDSRESKGLEIAKHATIAENDDGSFSVPSQSDKAVSYVVKVIGHTWTCDCPDFVNRADKIDSCKHVFAVRFWIASKVELKDEPKPKVFAEDATQCPKCGSIRVVKFGNYNGKQLYKCKDCKTKFREGLLKRTRYSPETIALTLDLYFSGTSFRKTARIISDHFGQTLGATTIYDWVQRFVPMISTYANSFTPKTSSVWHADELFVKMKDGDTRKSRTGKQTDKVAYLWNVMDRDTRFLLASKLSRYRDAVGGERAFKEAIANAHGSTPRKILTDALKGYSDAIGFAFGENKPVHVARVGIRKTLHKPDPNNNRIERLNGTLRERVKVQRGWKNPESKIAEGQRIHYNFVKPHHALDGKTPSEGAGIRIEGQNKWLTLIQNASLQQDG
jgi:putative transposase